MMRKLGLLLPIAILLAGCERPPVETVQLGYRGVAMEANTNPRLAARLAAANVVPVAQPPATGGAPLAKDVYQNIQVLTDLDVAEMTRLMLAITEWVSPEQGCNYCHIEDNLADDSVYQKGVSRQMLRMTRAINMDWKAHVGDTGVTCFTCHRGQNIPEDVWFTDPGRHRSRGLAADMQGQNYAAREVGSTSLPYDPFSAYLRDDVPIRVVTETALPSGNPRDIKDTEHTYAFMVHLSEGLGVNCTHCHNSRSFTGWEESTPQRVTAWHGIRMARDLNTAWLEPITGLFPANRLGPTGDVAKVNCATCHQGVAKPLNGVSMAADYPELTRIREILQAPPPDPSAEPVDAGAGAAAGT